MAPSDEPTAPPAAPVLPGRGPLAVLFVALFGLFLVILQYLLAKRRPHVLNQLRRVVRVANGSA